MASRVDPPPDRYAVCPQDGEVLEYYRGVFEWVYVMLSPFMNPVRLPFGRFEGDTYPTRKEIQEGCDPVRWEEVLKRTQLSDISAIDTGLRTAIRGLKTEFEDKASEEALLVLENEAQILMPNEGEHPDLLHDQVLSWIKELGYDWIWVGDEFCEERKLHSIDNLLSEVDPTIRGHANVFTPDKELLWTVHWDSHCTFFCGAAGHPAKRSIESKFEGFFCSERTHVHWGLHPI